MEGLIFGILRFLLLRTVIFSESNRWVPPSEGGQDTVPVSGVRVVEVD